jgi:hypothetical protein
VHARDDTQPNNTRAEAISFNTTVNDLGLRLSWDHGAAQCVNFRAPPDVF